MIELNNYTSKIFPAIWIVLTIVLVLIQANDLAADTVYDCKAKENRDTPTTVEIVLSQKWKGQIEEVKRSFTSGTEAIKIRVKFFPFLEPPTNIGVGKCVTAESARLAIRAAIKYSGNVDRLILQDILPHHWIKIGSTDLPELTWIPISPNDLARLTDPVLTTDQFQDLYRQLATQKERKLPFGMGSEKLSDRDASAVEVLSHEWHPDTVWERIGKTKFVWKVTVRNNSDIRKRVFVYYDLLDENNVPLARNVANKFIEPRQTIDVASDSYIESVELPRVKNSRATVKVSFTP